MKVSKILLGLALALSVTGCPAEEEEEENNNNTASCGNNESDGSAVPANTETFELGTKKTAKACYSTGSRYFYWKATGMYTDMDTFTVTGKILSSTAGHTLSLGIDDKTGTWSSSDYALTPSTLTVGGTVEGTDNDLQPVDTADSPSDALYIIAYVNGPGTDNTAVDFEFTVTKNAAAP